MVTVVTDVVRELQSTLPHGERPITVTPTPSGWDASIHAPARGATSQSIKLRGIGKSFNPRSRTGSDGCLLTYRA